MVPPERSQSSSIVQKLHSLILPGQISVSFGINRHRDESKSILKEYLSENIAKTNDNDDYETINDVYAAFKFWYRESYTGNKCPSKGDFTKYMEDHDYKVKRGKIVGIRFADDLINEVDNPKKKKKK